MASRLLASKFQSGTRQLVLYEPVGLRLAKRNAIQNISSSNPRKFNPALAYYLHIKMFAAYNYKILNFLVKNHLFFLLQALGRS